MRWIVLLAPLFLAACATAAVEPGAEAPTCSSERECAAKWEAAAMWIRHSARQHIVEQTDTRISTDMSPSPGNYLAVRVEKTPVRGDTFRIDVSMYCAKKVGCDPSPWEATQAFNRYVNNSWKVIGKPPGQ